MQRLLIVFLLCLGISHTVLAASQCAGIDVNNPSQVKTCIATSAIPGLDNMGKSMAGCVQLQYSVMTQAGSAKNGPKPKCSVIAEALTQINGRAPVWAPCVPFAETGRNPATCLNILLANQHNQAIDCAQAKNMLRSVRSQLTGDTALAAEVPGCEVIAKAMRDNNRPITGYECGNYLPDNQAHISQCLHAYWAGIGAQPKAINANCDQLRAFYQHGVQSMFDGKGMLPENPPNYQTPQCGMLENALASYSGPTAQSVGTQAVKQARPSEPGAPKQSSVAEPAQPNASATPPARRSQTTQSDDPLQRERSKLEQLQTEVEEATAPLEAAESSPQPAPEESSGDLKTEAKKELKNQIIKGLGL